MNTAEIEVTTLRLTDIPALDPVTVYLSNDGPGAGSVAVACYGRAWSAYFGAMGQRDIVGFLAGLDATYLTGKMASPAERTKKERNYLWRICDAVIAAMRVRLGERISRGDEDPK
jgi:hypothetical protein